MTGLVPDIWWYTNVSNNNNKIIPLSYDTQVYKCELINENKRTGISTTDIGRRSCKTALHFCRHFLLVKHSPDLPPNISLVATIIGVSVRTSFICLSSSSASFWARSMQSVTLFGSSSTSRRSHRGECSWCNLLHVLGMRMIAFRFQLNGWTNAVKHVIIIKTRGDRHRRYQSGKNNWYCSIWLHFLN